jgi:hypothetical protein
VGLDARVLHAALVGLDLRLAGLATLCHVGLQG